MIFDVLDIFDDFPAFGSSARYRGEPRNLMAKWTLGLALAGIVSVGLTSFIALITGIIAYFQIAATGQRGAGTAISGFILGLLITGGWTAFIIAVIVSALSS
ncbi:DUF4190 domain-containing protein [Brevibacterium luteolum]|uniref:DUF4190 domain-containing protein n=1 Tax=Brevibacterium luteolum TaxID=199591 RepID=A0A6G8KW95_9MICO|nr:DUF4190 domain-containing protein [Brevibacterium luteolum]QIN29094.1 DUF4190 domain-containing protein [Brevibacterium luteolum]